MTPTEPGYYWCRAHDQDYWEPVEVVDLWHDGRSLEFYKCGQEWTLVLSEWIGAHPESEWVKMIDPSHCQRCGELKNEYGSCNCDNDE